MSMLSTSHWVILAKSRRVVDVLRIIPRPHIAVHFGVKMDPSLHPFIAGIRGTFGIFSWFLNSLSLRCLG